MGRTTLNKQTKQTPLKIVLIYVLKGVLRYVLRNILVSKGSYFLLLLFKDSCPSYNIKQQRILEQFDCTSLISDCPRRQYFSRSILNCKLTCCIHRKHTQEYRNVAEFKELRILLYFILLSIHYLIS